MTVISKELSLNVVFSNKDDGFFLIPSSNVVSIFNDGSYNKLLLNVTIIKDIYLIYLMTVLR